MHCVVAQQHTIAGNFQINTERLPDVLIGRALKRGDRQDLASESPARNWPVTTRRTSGLVATQP